MDTKRSTKERASARPSSVVRLSRTMKDKTTRQAAKRIRTADGRRFTQIEVASWSAASLARPTGVGTIGAVSFWRSLVRPVSRTGRLPGCGSRFFARRTASAHRWLRHSPVNQNPAAQMNTLNDVRISAYLQFWDPSASSHRSEQNKTNFRSEERDINEYFQRLVYPDKP